MTHHTKKLVSIIYLEEKPIAVFAGPIRPKRQDHGSRQAREGRILKTFRKEIARVA